MMGGHKDIKCSTCTEKLEKWREVVGLPGRLPGQVKLCTTKRMS